MSRKLLLQRPIPRVGAIAPALGGGVGRDA